MILEHFGDLVSFWCILWKKEFLEEALLGLELVDPSPNHVDLAPESIKFESWWFSHMDLVG